MSFSVHIVRRYGSVGGMEQYVLQLTQALAHKKQRVMVLCEASHLTSEQSQALPQSLHIVELGNRYRKPRWLAQWGFSCRVSQYLDRYPQPDAVIHSHERTAVHHVTTFHGPPFMNRKKRVLDFLSPRIHMWSFLERRELLGSQVKAILPNSVMIGEQLAHFYPTARESIREPAYPGVDPHIGLNPQSDRRCVVGFLGKEWKRKGLEQACRIVEAMRQQQPDIHFLVAGCEPQAVESLFKAWPQEAYTLLGWVKTEAFLSRINLLLHPAKAEPFGMVIAESNAAGIPVAISDQCGIAHLIDASHGVVCSLDVDDQQWAESALALLDSKFQVSSLNLSWLALADQHIQLYKALENKTLKAI